MKVNFLLSKKQELKKLLNIYSDYQWFIDNDFPVVLPEFYKDLYLKTGKDKKEFKERLSEELDKIYSQSIYRKQKEIVEKNWQKIEKKFFDILKNFGLNIEESYFCYISLYGPEGQFQYPNAVNIKVSNSNDIKESNINIAHEIIHLAVFNKVKKLKLDYEQTEGIVDLFFTETEFKKLFADYKLQSIARHNKELFKKVVAMR